MSDSSNIRVRFAPSPTGYLHVGGARTALFNWLYARKTGGVFVLRVEDTDVERSTAESESSLVDDMRWLHLQWDEGPDVGAEYGPYRQSERGKIYRGALDKLIEKGIAYPCFCTDDILQQKKERAQKDGRPPQYDGTCRELSTDEVAAKRAAGEPEALRFRVPAGKMVFEDTVRGTIEMDTDMVGDFVLMRSNGLPTYNFAASVDDAHMKISHVLRGEDHLNNTLRQILIYNALDEPHPIFAHVPLILAEDRSKLSKRHAASSVGELRKNGYLPDAVMNYLVLLGWSHPEGKEKMTRDEMMHAFSLDRINKSAAIFDIKKLKWMNGLYIREMELDALFPLADAYFNETVKSVYDEPARREIVVILQDSLETLSDMDEQTAIFAHDVTCDEEARELLSTDGAREVLKGVIVELNRTSAELVPDAFKVALKAAGKAAGKKGKELFWPVRAALTGSVHGPDLARVAAVKGKDAVLNLLQKGLEFSA